MRRPGRRTAAMASFVVRGGRRYRPGVVITAVGRTIAAAAGLLFLLPLSASPAVPFDKSVRRRRITSGNRNGRRLIVGFVHATSRITVVRRLVPLLILIVTVLSAGIHGTTVASDRGVGRRRGSGDTVFAAAVLFPLVNGRRGFLVLRCGRVTIAGVPALVTRRPAPPFVRRSRRCPAHHVEERAAERHGDQQRQGHGPQASCFRGRGRGRLTVRAHLYRRVTAVRRIRSDDDTCARIFLRKCDDSCVSGDGGRSSLLPLLLSTSEMCSSRRTNALSLIHI